MFVFKTLCLVCGHECFKVVFFMIFAYVMGLLTGLYYDYVVASANNMSTVVRLELTDER
jgi:hypothetical protein